jgi:hypothetical protein
MACEKLVKAYRCDEGVDPETLLKSHACVAGTLPVILRQQAVFVNFKGAHAKWVMQHAKHLSQEIELLAPAVKRGGQQGQRTKNVKMGNLASSADLAFH